MINASELREDIVELKEELKVKMDSATKDDASNLYYMAKGVQAVIEILDKHIYRKNVACDWAKEEQNNGKISER